MTKEHKYNNKQAYISTCRDVDDLFISIALEGLKVRGTKEFINSRVVLRALQAKPWNLEWDCLKAEYKEAAFLFHAILVGNEHYTSEIYDAKHYVFLLDEMKNAASEIMKEGTDTRRANISFPSTHCFESIQVLIRGKSMYVTVNMRSCNAYKNLMNDLCLAHFIAYHIAFLACIDKDVTSAKVVANIGSLHLFEGDVQYVL